MAKYSKAQLVEFVGNKPLAHALFMALHPGTFAFYFSINLSIVIYLSIYLS